MTITVKNGLCEKVFANEIGKPLAVLRSTKLFGSEKVVVGPDKMVR